jgi:translation initiation factor IF-1
VPRPTAAALLALLALAPAPCRAQAQKAPTVAGLRAEGARQMTAAEVNASRIGNTWYFLRLADGAVMSVHYRDGRTKTANLGGRKRESVWWLEGDRICEDSFVRTGHICGAVWMRGGQMYFCEDGVPACLALVRQVPGNPDGL